MFRFLKFILFLFLIGLTWPYIEKQLSNSNFEQMTSQLLSQFSQLKDKPEVLSSIDSFYEELLITLQRLDSRIEELPLQEENEQKEKNIELKAPANQIFSIYNVEIGDKKESIEGNVGASKRTTENEYGTSWSAYHNNYHEFFMVMYDKQNKAVGLYTNQDLISSINGVKLGSSKENVRAQLGEPITELQKGFFIYQLQKDNDYDLFLVDGVYVTIFYDKHQNNTVTALQIISKDLEQNKSELYTKASSVLKEGFEYQLFDLTNASRVEHQLPILTWDEHVRETARKHSMDMANNNYFSHTNLDGESPFDRMKEDDIAFQLAGENLAYGQFSSIFAHEGLMNSLGHRKNILRKDFQYLGIGVAFNDESHPYFTQNFFTK